MRFNKTLVAALLASSMLAAGAAQAKSLVYCSEGSPENFSPSMNTTGTSFDAARPVYLVTEDLDALPRSTPASGEPLPDGEASGGEGGKRSVGVW